MIGVTGIVLAGGLSRRLGRDKAVEPIDGQPLILRVINRLEPLTDEIVVVVNSDARGKELPLPDTVRVTLDVFADSGSLGGIYSGLSAASNAWGFVVACDMPFLNQELIAHLLALRSDSDAVVPVLDGYPEPTHAAYSKPCLPHIERRLKAGQLKIAGFFDSVSVRYVSEADIERFEADRLSFFNVNTQDDLARAVSLAAEGR